MKHLASFLLSLLLHFWVGAVLGDFRFLYDDLQNALMRLGNHI